MLSRFNSSIHRALTRISYDRNRPRQSINQPINQAINQSIKQPIDRSINRWIEAGGYLGAVSITSVAIAREQRQQLLELEVGDRWRRRCRSRRRCRGEPRLVHGAERHAYYDEASSIVQGVWLRVGYSTLQAWVLRGDTVDLAAGLSCWSGTTDTFETESLVLGGARRRRRRRIDVVRVVGGKRRNERSSSVCGSKRRKALLGVDRSRWFNGDSEQFNRDSERVRE